MENYIHYTYTWVAVGLLDQKIVDVHISFVAAGIADW